MTRPAILAAALFAMTSSLAPTGSAADDALLTVAEASNYERTSKHAEVMDLIGRIDERSDILCRASMGTTVEGRDIPLVILANPLVTSAADAKARGKPVIFAFANIHAGEVEGKEALLMLARELALDPQHDLLKHLVVVLAPIYNGDGNDRFGPNDVNRPGQKGPIEMGVRPNAQNLDLNRDYVKLESPEARAMVKFLTEWDPHLIIDCHTTNGSYHRYTLTYDAPTNPSGAAEPIEFIRDTVLPEITKRLFDRTGYDTFFYGDFNREHTAWVTYAPHPRFGGPYHGLRGQMSILSEAYSYAPFKDRTLCTLEFVREILTYAAQHAAQMIEIHDRAKADTIARGESPQPDDVVGIRHRIMAAPRLVIAKGFEYETPGGGGESEAEEGRGSRRGVRPVVTDRPKDYPVVHLGRFEAARSVPRPWAYIIPAGNDDIVEKLHQHGVSTKPFSGAAMVEVGAIDSINRSTREFQGHFLQTLETTTREDRRRFDNATLVLLAQPLGNLIVYLLEAESEDGFAAWELFIDRLVVGRDYPVVRVRKVDDLEPTR
jgi:dipeptidyl-peptidase-4